ncbi:MAG: hypothetical protein RBT64_03725 [Trichloromonas sp.]|jgi:hypothetical protein|nr:hypothetical protein [Trichloromonas sp.]
MNQEHLQRFAEQLAHWAGQALTEGRFPFRRVDLHPPLLTEAGEESPALVFWINRESHMAGGLLLLPPAALEDVAESGRRCAAALGLRHFAVWAPHELSIWEIRVDRLLRHRDIPLSGDHPGAFQQALRQLMEALKPLSVLGAVPAADLEGSYLANLWRVAPRDSRDALEEGFRTLRASRREAGENPQERACDKGVLTLLRLLALAACDRLPNGGPPEELETALSEALTELPEGLRESLAPAPWEMPLPFPVAVRFHHLARRLGQLDVGRDRQRLLRALDLFAAGEDLGAGADDAPLPDGEEPVLLLHPPLSAARQGRRALMEAGRPALLALLALRRELAGLPPSLRRSEDIFSLMPAMPPRLIRGRLDERRIPDREERAVLTTRLRSSWPTRRFRLDAKAPRWHWEFLHLLGLAAEEGHIILDTPAGWLNAPAGEALVELLREEFTLIEVALTGTGGLRLELVKARRPEQGTHFLRTAGERTLPWRELVAGHRALLPLALGLDGGLFPLLKSGRLAIPTSDDWPADRGTEAFLFSRSTLGRHLWSIVAGDRPLPEIGNLRECARRFGLPLPGREVLDQLRLLDWHRGRPLPATELLDQAVERWLGATRPPSVTGDMPPASPAPPRPAPPSAALLARIVARVFIDGIPRFPEHYLYDHYRPELVNYRLTPPLALREEFFGRFTLVDGDDKTLTVDGEETAQALLLAAAGGRREVALPRERALTEAILSRYRADLRALRGKLIQACHAAIPQAATADRIAEKLWRDQSLPPVTFLGEAD